MINVKGYSLGLLSRAMSVYTFIKIILLLFGRRKKNVLLNGVEEIDRSFKHVEKK